MAKKKKYTVYYYDEPPKQMTVIAFGKLHARKQANKRKGVDMWHISEVFDPKKIPLPF